MDRVEKFLGARLRGRPAPADLRRLVEMQLDGELERDDRVQPFWEIRVLSADEVHPLEQPVEPLASDPRPEETRANSRAILGVLAHVAPVVDGFNGDLWGYWLHPDEPRDGAPLIVKLDTEGTFSIQAGASLVEAMIFDFAGEDDISGVAEYCDAHGIPLSSRSADELEWRSAVVDPAVLQEKLYKREHPMHERPAWSDEPGAAPDAAPIGARHDDVRVVRALAAHGISGDLPSLIRAADTGEGEVVLQASACAAEFEFHRETASAWFVHQMRFFNKADAAPACANLPLGFEMGETREQCHARFGEPGWKSPIGAIDRWRLGHVHLHVVYGKDGKPRKVTFMPALGND